jgi:hypothetical protein
MIEIYCAYSGTHWKKFECDSTLEAESFLDTLRPAEKRPSHIIFSHIPIALHHYALEILWTPQIFVEITDGELYGGMENTRKYLQRFLPKIKDKAIPI